MKSSERLDGETIELGFGRAGPIRNRWLESAGEPDSIEPNADRGSPRVAIGAIFRSEYPYVVEWLAYHRVLGIGEFIIADNVSDDGTSELLMALDHVGLIHRIHFPDPEGEAGPQVPAYEAIMRLYAKSADWIGFIDGDEFIVPTSGGGSVQEWLAQMGRRRDVGAIALNWAVYGSGWQASHGPGLVIERFQRRAAPDFLPNLHFKSLVQACAFAGFLTCHAVRLRPGWRRVHADGREVALEQTCGSSQELVWEPFRLNHYVVKSHEEFTRKRLRGRATTRLLYRDEDFFTGHDRNEVLDPFSLDRIIAIKEEIARIESLLSGSGYVPPLKTTAATAKRIVEQGPSRG